MLTTERDIPVLDKAFDQIIDRASFVLSQQEQEEISIDCAKITVIRSSMLDRLIRLHLDAQRAGSRLVLQNVNEFVLDVFRKTRLDRMLRIRLDQSHRGPLQHQPKMHTK